MVQDARVDFILIFNVPKLIAYCSLWTELRPGDVIVTGTPGGVSTSAMIRRLAWMKPGDEIRGGIPENVGQLTNRVVDES